MTDHVSGIPQADGASVAVVNVHWQRDIAARDGAFGALFAASVEKSAAVEHAGAAIGAVREAGGLVCYARAAFRPGYLNLSRNCALWRQTAASGCLVEGTPGAEIIDALRPGPGEPVVTHARLSAFHGTDLELVLRCRGVTTVLLTGVATNIAVESTARDAVSLGFRTILVSDACAAATDDAHRATLETFQLLGETTTSADLPRLLSRQ